MSNDILVSIIVPVYNTSQWLDTCIESLINQTLQNIEIICVNDASTDDSLVILREWEKKDNRIIVIDSPINKKQGGARNLGILKARGKYLGFVDSDDFISVNMYKNLIENSDEYNADIVTTTNYYAYYGDKTYVLNNLSNVKAGSYVGNSLIELKKKIVVNGCRMVTNIIRRELFIDNNLLYPENVFYEDNANSELLFVMANNIAVSDSEPFYYYRCNNMSTTRSKNNKRFFDRLYTANLFYEWSKKMGVYNQYKSEIDYAYYKLYYHNTILGVVNRFTYFPKKEIAEMVSSYKSRNIDIRQNPYYHFSYDKILVDMLATFPSYGNFIMYVFHFFKKICKKLR